MTDIIINGKDAKKEWGVSMDVGTLNALNVGVPVKEYVTNTSRLKDGVEYLGVTPVDERQITLNLSIIGNSMSDFTAKRDAFYEMLYSTEDITVSVPKDSSKVYHLRYKNCTSYKQGLSRMSCKVAVQFVEPNPRNRQ